MSQRCIVSDPFRFAAEGRKISGTVPLLRLNRLADILFRSEGEVTYALSGDVGVDGKAFLRLEASGVLALQCQRCLSGLDWPLELESLLHLVTPGTPIPDEELEIESFDTIEAVADMDVLALLEEEILLAMPIVPRHEDCDAPHPEGGADKESPFAALAGLRKNSGAH
ncbi:MAG TPA: YceD family protein [Rhodocyclaceae bacterium]|nr:YceD family protein [Rhodocyclaceae bacterium]HRQ48072.1 YceD family protein [Rhodocyclaceae bacterium]